MEPKGRKAVFLRYPQGVKRYKLSVKEVLVFNVIIIIDVIFDENSCPVKLLTLQVLKVRNQNRNMLSYFLKMGLKLWMNQVVWLQPLDLQKPSLSDQLTRHENEGQVEASNLGPFKTSSLSEQLTMEENEGSKEYNSHLVQINMLLQVIYLTWTKPKERSRLIGNTIILSV